MKTATENTQTRRPIDENKIFALVPRKVVIHRMATAETLEDKLFWAIILLSFCGPNRCEYAALRDENGFLSKVGGLYSEQEKLAPATSPEKQKLVKLTSPIPAKCRDLLKLLGLGLVAEGNASRALASLEAKGLIRKKDGKIYPIKEPVAPAAPVAPEEPLCKIGRLTVMTLDLDRIPPERRKEFEALAQKAKDELAAELKSLEEARKACIADKENWLREQLSAFDIIIPLKSKSSKREPAAASSKVDSAPPPPQQAHVPQKPTQQATPPPSEPSQNLSEIEARPDDVERLSKGLSTPNEIWDEEATRDLWRKVRAIRKNATVGQILHAVSVKRNQNPSGINNWIGFLKKTVPQMASGNQWQVVELYVEHELKRMMENVPAAEAVLADSTASEDLKIRATQFLKKIELWQ